MNLHKGLVGHWTMDDRDTDNGFIRDRSANSNHGNLLNGVGTGMPSPIGQACVFDGSDDEMPVGNPKVDLTGNITIAFWCRADNPGNQRETIFQKAFGGEFTINVEDDSPPSQLRIYMGEAGSNSTPYDSHRFDGVFEPSTWVHVVWIRDVESQEGYAYINGEPHPDNPENHSGIDYIEESDNQIVIGSGYTNTLDGALTDCRIYNRKLSEKEIRALYNMRNRQVRSV